MRNTTKIQEFIETLSALIQAGAPGFLDRLPSRRELAAQYGISPASVQIALQELEKRGLVTNYPQKGSRVNPRRAARLRPQPRGRRSSRSRCSKICRTRPASGSNVSAHSSRRIRPAGFGRGSATPGRPAIPAGHPGRRSACPGWPSGPRGPAERNLRERPARCRPEGSARTVRRLGLEPLSAVSGPDARIRLPRLRPESAGSGRGRNGCGLA